MKQAASTRVEMDRGESSFAGGGTHERFVIRAQSKRSRVQLPRERAESLRVFSAARSNAPFTPDFRTEKSPFARGARQGGVCFCMWKHFAVALCVAAFALVATGQENPSAAPMPAERPASEIAAPAASSGDIIYPRQAAAAEAPAVPTKAGGGNRTLLLLAVGVAATGGWVLWRQRNAVGGNGAQARKLSVTESRPLGNRQYLVVADYDGKKFLLGVCPGRIEMLTPLDDTKVTAAGAKKDGGA